MPATRTRSSATTATSSASSASTATDRIDQCPVRSTSRSTTTTTARKKIVVRGVTLLDYTAGGPAFRPDLFDSGRTEFGLAGDVDIGGHDEVHGETGDDTVYLGGGNDVAVRRCRRRRLIGGWGNDWISGGTGQDGVLGDDGRIFTSRNTAHAASASRCTASPSCWPATRTRSSATATCINEFIYTPGQVQTATINVAGALNKAVDITPFNLTPNAQGGGRPRLRRRPVRRHHLRRPGRRIPARRLRRRRRLRGRGGDRVVRPALRRQRRLIGVVRSDWTRPYNGGDMLAFGADDDSWHHNHPARASSRCTTSSTRGGSSASTTTAPR